MPKVNGDRPRCYGPNLMHRPRPDEDAEHQHAEDEHEGALAESRAWNVMAYMLSGVLGFGLPAWLLDRWLGTVWLTPLGLLAGMAVALATIWFRYGTDRP
jgi:hypothetical protein